MLRSILIQIVCFVLIFNLLSWFRELSMLPTDQVLAKPQATYTSLAGKQFKVEAQQGKTTVVYFFAPWCQICNLSIGNLQSTYERSMNLEVIAVALDFDNKQEVEKFVAKHKLTFPVVLGSEELKQQFKIKGYPSYYVLNKQNKVVSRSLGYSSEFGLYLRTF